MNRRVLTILIGLTLTIETGALRGQEASVDPVQERIRRIKQVDKRTWESIPWVPSLLDARRISAEEKRPVFLFTFEGNLRTGRC